MSAGFKLCNRPGADSFMNTIYETGISDGSSVKSNRSLVEIRIIVTRRQTVAFHFFVAAPITEVLKTANAGHHWRPAL
jgi:hypothetical protein